MKGTVIVAGGEHRRQRRHHGRLRHLGHRHLRHGRHATAATGPQLANTGMDVAALAVLGALMCLLGVAVRRRSADEAPRPAVPNGW